MKKNSGSAMLVILMVLATLSACVVASLNFTSVISRDVQRSNTLRSAYSIGDGATEYAFTQWRETCRVPKPNIQLPTSSFTSIPAPSSSYFPDVAGYTASTGANPGSGTPYTIANFKVVAADQFFKPMSTASATPAPQHGMSLGTANYNYLCTADVTLPTMVGRPISIKMRRIFTKSMISPWNYAIFYVDDLEHHPGAAASVTGWVHTNAKLYTGHNTLTYQSKVSYGDDWSKNFKPGDDRYGSETPTSPDWQDNLPPFRDQGQQPFGLDATRIFSTTDTSANNDSYRELVEAPSSGTDPVDTARYYNQADIKIMVNSSGTITFKNLAGTTISSTSTGNDLKLYNTFKDAVAVGATITDKREGTSVRMIDIDVSVVKSKLTSLGTAFNGVVYATDSSVSTTTERAVRLKNGASIPTGGLTVATDLGLYIQGDYNTGRTGTGSGEPPSNKTSSPDFTKPQVSSYTRQPCAVLADAVMILSNNWSDSNSSLALASRPASNTTVNCAIVSGIVPTASGNYSGGAENFPRFLETWSGDNFTYYGSMVELYPSKYFNTPWKNTGAGPNVYDPPVRQWYFDENFWTTPPPGTLLLVAYNKGRWFVE